MNIIDTGQIVDPNIEQPFTGPSLSFLQSATKEAISGIMQSIIGDQYTFGTPYAVNGLAFGGTQSAPSGITGGFIYYNDELFQCPGHGGSFSIANQFNIVQTNPSPDPLTFSDNNPRNVHNVRKIQVTDSAIPGAFQLSSVVYLKPIIATASITGSGYTGTVKYFLDFFKQIVYINGSLNKTSPTTGDTLFTLPTNMRPTVGKFLPCVLSNSSGNTVSYLLEIDTTGDVKVSFAPTISGAMSFYLDGLSFYINW